MIADVDSIFSESILACNKSATCRLLQTQLEDVFLVKKVTKIICFGLGDMCRKPPEWYMKQEGSSDYELAVDSIRPSTIQHSVALTTSSEDACLN